jgi:hypothetical protein
MYLQRYSSAGIYVRGDSKKRGSFKQGVFIKNKIVKSAGIGLSVNV